VKQATAGQQQKYLIINILGPTRLIIPTLSTWPGRTDRQDDEDEIALLVLKTKIKTGNPSILATPLLKSVG
jgi:hypothetical protein